MKIVYVNARGGLGNQFSFLSKGVEVATNLKASLLVDLRDCGSPANFSEVANISFFKFNFPIKVLFITKNSPFYLIITGNTYKLINIFISQFYKKFKIFQRNFIDIRKQFEGSETAIKAMDLKIFDGLELNSTSPDFQKVLKIVKNNQSIGIHVRLTDYKYFHDGTLILDKNYYLSQIKKLSSKNTRIFLFSDNPEEVESMFLNDFNFINVSKDFNLNAAEELVILSKCFNIIGSHSTFCFWASLLKSSNKGVIVVPIGAAKLDGWKVSS
jgi:hypothetical protein